MMAMKVVLFDIHYKLTRIISYGLLLFFFRNVFIHALINRPISFETYGYFVHNIAHEQIKREHPL